MELNDAIKYALDGKALLFTGAGFSIDKENNETLDRLGRPLMHSKELSKHLLELCNISVDENNIPDLDKSAQFCRTKLNGLDLIKALKDAYTISSCASWQKTILDVPWQRIYTTNYDDLPSFARKQSANKSLPKLKSVTIDKKIKDIYDKSNLCIYLNGFIDDLNEENIDTQFKLTSKSYSSSSFSDSEWSAIFRLDIKSAKAVFFVGYSLYDLDIKRILNSIPSLNEKIFFFLGPSDEIDKEIVRSEIVDYGTDTQKTASELAKLIENLAVNHTYSIEEEPMHSFSRYIQDRGIHTTIPSDKVSDLLTWGDVSFSFITSAINNNLNYIVNRSSIPKITNKIVNNGTDIVIHSDIGNGKSTFCAHLALSLTEYGFDVYKLNSSASFEQDINKILKSNEKIAIIVENFFNFEYEIKSILKQRNSNIRLIVTARTPDYEVRNSEWLDNDNDPFEQLDLNKLDTNEIEQLINLIDLSGLWREFAAYNIKKKTEIIKLTYQSQFHSILIGLIKSKEMQTRLKEYLNFSKLSNDEIKLISGVFILQIVGFDFDADDVSEITGARIQYNSRRKNEVITRILYTDDGKLKAKSSAIAKYSLNYLIDPAVVFTTLESLLKNTYKLSKYRKESIFNSLLRELFLFRNISRIISNNYSKESIYRYYDLLGELGNFNDDPMYWLQYAIAKLFTNDLEKSDDYFQTAYSLAQRRDQYNTFKIDNHYARFLIESSINNYDSSLSKTVFQKSRSIIERQIADSNNRHYPYKVATLYLDFYNIYSQTMTDQEKTTFIEAIKRILKGAKAAQSNDPHKDISKCIKTLSVIIDNN